MKRKKKSIGKAIKILWQNQRALSQKDLSLWLVAQVWIILACITKLQAPAELRSQQPRTCDLSWLENKIKKQNHNNCIFFKQEWWEDI